MDVLIYLIIIFLILSIFLNIIVYAWPFLLIMFVVYEIWKYFKLKKIRKQYEESQSSTRNDNPDIIDVEYKVVDEEKTGDDQ